MALPAGTTPHLGPVVDTSGVLLAPSIELRDAGAISFRAGRVRKVNTAGNDWEDIAGGGLLYGSGVPDAALGNDGFAYLDIATLERSTAKP